MDAREATAKFGAELRYHRRRAGLSQEALAARLRISQGQISKLELALRKPPRDLCGALDRVLAQQGHFIDLHDRLFEPRRGADEWFLSYLDLEPRASVIRSWDLALVPGLFQTEEYARLIFTGGLVKRHEIEDRVNARLARQEILEREDCPEVYALIDEGVLYRPIGGPAVMLGQLKRLVEANRHPAVCLQVVPYGAQTTTGLTSGFVMVQLPDGTAYVSVESAGASTLSSDHELIQQSVARLDRLRTEALNRIQSTNLIEEGIK
ncbi:helix-turn-helix transcriptional regulator [Sphaerisporangium rubeum]